MNDLQQQIADQQQKLARAQQEANAEQQFESLYKMADLYNQQHDYQQAILTHQRAAALALEMGDTMRLFRSGISLSVLQEYPQAINCMKQAIEISLQQPNGELQARQVTSFLADLYTNFLDDVPQAIHYYQEALKLAQKLEKDKDEVHILCKLGESYQKVGKSPEALEYYNRARTIANKHDNHVELASILTDIATLHASLGHQIEMTTHFEKALTAAQASNDSRAQSSVLIWWGHAYREHPDLSRSISYYQQALAVAQASGDVDEICGCLSILAHVSEKQGNKQEAVDLYQQLVTLLGQARDNQKSWAGFSHFIYTNSLEHIGELYDEMGNPTTALQYLDEALASSDLPGHVKPLEERIATIKSKLNSTSDAN
ncbi:MAG: tetratricopeptide repeat protein [Chloroflexi bacterium]|nr:tetratricopeptide repeat protein [Chloroflexota bacterium]MCC6893201.1 tetratricopeptide repeat protein [Anaerolineae bacterium]